jgi:hypothetical protein
MKRSWALLIVVLALAGCGVAETGASATSAAESATQQATQARTPQDQVRRQIDAAYSEAAEQRRAAEADAK